MIINITQHCSLRCPHCMQNAGPERNEMMTKETFEKSIQFAKNIGSRVIMISGGEPTTHPMFLDFLKILKHQSFLSIVVLSNGTFIKDHKFTEQFAEIVQYDSRFSLQISSFKGLYANYGDVHKPGLKALRMFGKRVVVCDTPDDIHMQPLGRACSGPWYEEAKRVNSFPSCTNSCLILAQSEELPIGALMELQRRFCLPMVSWNGSIRLGESEQCKVVAHVTESLETINQKLFAFRPCGCCDSFKWHFLKPHTTQEKLVSQILWPDNK